LLTSATIILLITSKIILIYGKTTGSKMDIFETWNFITRLKQIRKLYELQPTAMGRSDTL